MMWNSIAFTEMSVFQNTKARTKTISVRFANENNLKIEEVFTSKSSQDIVSLAADFGVPERDDLLQIRKAIAMENDLDLILNEKKFKSNIPTLRIEKEN